MKDLEISFYAQKLATTDPDTVATIQSIEIYNDAQKLHAMAEIAYYHEFEQLPEWGYVIAYVEKVNGDYLFVHNDPYGAH